MLSFPAFRTLLWLGTQQPGQQPPEEVCPADDARAVFEELVGMGFSENTADLSGGFDFFLTAEGRTAAHRFRGEYRPEVARRAVLSHLNEAGGELVGLDGLEASVRDYTGPFTDRDIAEAADDLEHHGMIAGQRQANGRFYLARITPVGRTALRGTSPIGTTTGGAPMSSTHYSTSHITTITGDHNQVAAGVGGDVTQHASTDNSTTIDYQAVNERVQALLADLPNLTADPVTMTDIQTTAEVIQDQIGSERPDPTVVTGALNALRGLLSPIGLGISGAVTAASTALATGYIQDFTTLIGL